MTAPERVLITGTTTGIGRALLGRYSERGANVTAVNRRRVPELEAQYPDVRFECVDVRSFEQVARLMSQLSESDELPDVLILNAGINRVDNDECFEFVAYKDVVNTNLFGVVHFVESLTRLPPRAVPCHIVAVGSMASYVGNPYGLGYFISKRALSACFDVWSRMYADTELVFQHVMLGPVRTNMHTMVARFPAWIVWLRDVFSASVDGTVAAICQFAQGRSRRLFYPRRVVLLYLGMWACRLLIPGFFRGTKTMAGAVRRSVMRA